MQNFKSFVLASLCLPSLGLSAAVRRQADDARSALTSASNGWSANTVISFPNDTVFAEATERWTLYEAPTYWAAVSPGTEEDVAKVVKLATRLKLPLLATGGRHGYGTELGNLDNGLSIDLSRLNQVVVDKESGTLTVDGGVRFRDMVDVVWDAGFEIQTGSCSCPGMIGVTIGAGIGRLQGEYGLIIDALQSARIVTAKGEILDVSEDSNPDLFWGIRGAGANMGIITKATYKLHPNPAHDTFTSLDVIFPGSKNASYFDMLQSLLHSGNSSHPGLESKLSATAAIVYNETAGEAQILANWAYKGPREEALKAFQPMLDLEPEVALVLDLPWNTINTVSGFGSDAATCTPGKTLNMYSANLRRFDASTAVSVFESMSRFYAEHPDARASSVLLESFPSGAVNEVSNTATAFPWRDTITYILMQFQWDPSSSSAEQASNALGREMRNAWAETSGYDGLAIYVNYAHGDEDLDTVYGENLPRLAGLKAEWDPTNVFAFNNPLPVS